MAHTNYCSRAWQEILRHMDYLPYYFGTLPSQTDSRSVYCTARPQPTSLIVPQYPVQGRSPPLQKSCSDEPRIPDAGEQVRERNCGLALYHLPWHRSKFSGFLAPIPFRNPTLSINTYSLSNYIGTALHTSINLVAEFIDIQG